jgi:hypothetical protein
LEVLSFYEDLTLFVPKKLGDEITFEEVNGLKLQETALKAQSVIQSILDN